ncbi:MAG: hypothetical protein GKR89_10715 [Candidatus Latescibacteria bacterium]|nr:hypothetical protein [Candidatus Latescibacterota bacterium]
MKSALELAMEKAAEAVGDDYIKLSPEQIEAVDKVKKEYEAKWAERDLVFQADLAKLNAQAAQADPQALAEHRHKLQENRNQMREQIYAERDQKVDAIRRPKS